MSKLLWYEGDAKERSQQTKCNTGLVILYAFQLNTDTSGSWELQCITQLPLWILSALLSDVDVLTKVCLKVLKFFSPNKTVPLLRAKSFQSLDTKVLSKDDARYETHFPIQTLRVNTGVMWNKLYPSGHQGALVNEILWQWSLAAVNFVISATVKQQDEWLGTLHPTHLKGHRPHRWDGQKIYKLMGNGVKSTFICLAIGFGMATFRTS